MTKANNNNKMINTLKRVNANPEYRVIVWYSHIQSHFRYASIIWNPKILHWEKKGSTMTETVGKLVATYNKLYKNMMNINNKTDNNTLLKMQGKNQLLNIVEFQSISTIMRLLISNKHFHQGKVGT